VFPSYLGQQHLPVLLGGAFHYMASAATFRNLDALVDALNAEGRFEVRYSTPSEFAESLGGWPPGALARSGRDLTQYADRDGTAWTGVHSSRSGLKGYLQHAGRMLQFSRQMEAVGQLLLEDYVPEAGWTDALDEAVAAGQDHNTLAGAVRQAVADDVAFRLHGGMEGAWQGARQTAEAVLGLYGGQGDGGPGGRGPAPLGGTLAPVLHHCPHLNVTLCQWSAAATASGKNLLVVAWNPLGWEARPWIRFPVSRPPPGRRLAALDAATAEELPSQVLALSGAHRYAREAWLDATHDPSLLGGPGTLLPDAEMWVQAALPALGLAGVQVAAQEAPGGDADVDLGAGVDPARGEAAARDAGAGASGRRGCGGDGNTIANEHYEVTLSPATGLVESVRNLTDGVKARLSVDVLSYREGPGGGVHVFQPDGSGARPVRGVTTEAVCPPSGAMELRQEFGDSAAFLTIRLVPGAAHVEVEWTVGSVDLGPGETGRDVVVRFSSDLRNAGLTGDANGLFMVPRTPAGGPDDAAAFFPASSLACLTEPGGAAADDRRHGHHPPRRLCVALDRGLGVSGALGDGGSRRGDGGSLEVMVHRRVLSDDGKNGLGEPLDEDMCGSAPPGGSAAPGCRPLVVSGRLFLRLTERDSPATTLGGTLPLRESPWLMFAVEGRYGARGGVAAAAPPGVSFLGRPLPENVHLQTLQWAARGTVLVRLRHLFPPAGDLGKPAAVDIPALFGDRFVVRGFEVVSLTASRPDPYPVTREEAEGMAARGDVSSDALDRLHEGGHGDVVIVRPMDIVTLFVRLDAADSPAPA